MTLKLKTDRNTEGEGEEGFMDLPPASFSSDARTRYPGRRADDNEVKEVEVEVGEDGACFEGGMTRVRTIPVQRVSLFFPNDRRKPTSSPEAVRTHPRDRTRGSNQADMGVPLQEEFTVLELPAGEGGVTFVRHCTR